MIDQKMKATASRKWKKLPAKYAAWIVPLLLSGLMSATLAWINMLLHVGWSADFVMQWLNTWLVSWLIAYPTVLVFLPLVRRLTGLIVEMPPHH